MRARPTIAELDGAVLGDAGTAASGVREACFRYAEAVAVAGSGSRPPDLDEAALALVDKVARHAYKVLPGDIDALLDSGWSDDQVLELILAAACGAGRGRLDAGLAALGEAAR